MTRHVRLPEVGLPALAFGVLQVIHKLTGILSVFRELQSQMPEDAATSLA